MSKGDQEQLVQYMMDLKFIPGGRFLYYSRRPLSYWSNCYALICEDDSREEWANISYRAMSALSSGGGIGVDYSILRGRGRYLSRSGGISSGPVPLMESINGMGRAVIQGGKRRSAILASLNWQHDDIRDFMHVKQWNEHYRHMKELNIDYPAPLDYTNVSVSYDDDLLEEFYGDHWNPEDPGPLPTPSIPETFRENVRLALQTGEPGFLFNFGRHTGEVGRNACGEWITPYDSGACCLGSINLSRIESIDELRDVTNLAAKFLVCGNVRCDLPYEKARLVREKHREIGLGLLGVHEWLIQRSLPYAENEELAQWLACYEDTSRVAADEHSDRFYLPRPRRYRAVAPAGTIARLANTTTGIEPIFAIAYKQRMLEDGEWVEKHMVDPTAERIMQATGVDSQDIETALGIDPKDRINFQAFMQQYVDMGISSTINLPVWGTQLCNDEDTVDMYVQMIAESAHKLRGLTLYPQGGRSGQPLEEIDYNDIKGEKEYGEEDSCAGGVCGV
jgi:ribonucleoside-diphosphate reductase alpha chain